MGFVDLHCHLLWDTDDGARTPDESLLLCRSLTAHGFTEAAPTPHAWPELPDAAANARRRGELSELLEKHGVGLTLHPGAENRLEGDLFPRIERGDARTLGQGRWVLVEAPHKLPMPGVEQLCFRLRVAGYSVLIAHPERCKCFFDDPGLARRLVEQGCALQLEIGSFCNTYGKASEKFARSLLDEGLAAIAASDVHRPESAARLLDAGLPALRKAAGDAGLQRLLEHNPRRILRGETLS
ncbi:MAG: protein tyrosine phosphatase [Deltaproteobacteria bacterium]|nr:protein tyrosine phosphatase [Deltaproteobacteria bacterium]